MTFGVNHQDWIVGENVVARGYGIPLIKIIQIYIISTNIINSTCSEIEKRNKHWLELESENQALIL